MDPANNQIKYKVPSGIPTDKPTTKFYYRLPFNYPTYLSYDSCKGYFESMESIDICLKSKNYEDYLVKKFYTDSALQSSKDYLATKYYNFETQLSVEAYLVTKQGGNYKSIEVYLGLNIDIVDPPPNKDKYLPLETVAEQVISNADAGSLDAQVATNMAAQNILNDVVQAEPVVQELENNAKKPPCITVSGKVVTVGTYGYRHDKVPPSKPHYPFTGDHYNLYRANQNPNNGECFWVESGAADASDGKLPPPNSIPIEPFI